MVELSPNLQRLKEEYAERLPEKMAHLDGLVRQLAHPDSSGEVLAALALAVHRMHGSAGTYGFLHAGRVAGEWEKALEPLRKTGLPLERGDFDLMTAYFRDLQSAIASQDSTPERDRATLALVPDAAPEPPGAAGARKPRILLVEDDRDLSVWIEEILRGKGWNARARGRSAKG
jgi:chemotaxis protein histidine kinase CheA